MLAPFKLIALSCVGLLVALVPANALPASRGLSIGSPQTVLDSLTLGCPSMTISCVKDGDYPKGIVGDIGKKEFCFSFPRCYQCEEDANSDECNITFEECEGTCQAFSPIPF